jgi:hypothetical protein
MQVHVQVIFMLLFGIYPNKIHSFYLWDLPVALTTFLVFQMDVEEFMNQLFDRIETQLKPQPQQTFLKDFFGGKSTQQIISKVCM